LRNIDALKRALAKLKHALAPTAILVNDAARDDRHDWREVTPAYERIASNLRHMFFAIQAVAPDMIAAGKGSIIILVTIPGGSLPGACRSTRPLNQLCMG
jgi:NAD(P)-dependent dehydrogenase (short-subunit alcohol dehydrogenase family)